MKNLPKKIYLQIGDIDDTDDWNDLFHSAITWADDRINKNDIEFVLSEPDGNSIVIPKPRLNFEGLDNISITGKSDIPLSELFELHLKLENYLKSRPEAIINESSSIVGFKNYL